MAALPNSPVNDSPEEKYYQDYFADASVFSAELQQPFEKTIDPKAQIELPKEGGYKYQPADPFKDLKGIISYQSGYTQVAGHKSTKIEGFTTLATSVVEGLNVLDVLTADRVVGQISTVHPYSDKGRVPSVTFLGTRFENLRISGQKVEVEPILDILGPKPADDRSYFDDDGVYNRLTHQYANIKRFPGLPDWANAAYDLDGGEMQRTGQMKCSLVNGVDGAPGTTFGHVIDLPHFGKIFLGELNVERKATTDPNSNEEYYRYIFHLNMIRLDMGCLAKGTAKVAALDTNGQGGHH